MNVVELVEKIRRDHETISRSVTSLWASLEGSVAVYQTVVAKMMDDATATARSLQPTLELLEAEREHQRLVESALEVVRHPAGYGDKPAMPVVPGLEKLSSSFDEDVEDDRRYPGQYL